MVKISKVLRNKVWNTYIGQDKGIGKCYVCDTQISQQNFECGHVIAAALGGNNNIDNFRPICGTCNKSMGVQNLEDFKKANCAPQQLATTMNIINIPLSELYVSEINVRKALGSSKDETNIQDLAEDIKVNGLLNPLTVRQTSANKYDVIAGQRRLLALRLLNVATVTCNIIAVDDKHAEELSLVENIQRNPMSIFDKIRAYNSVYKRNNRDINKTVNAIHVSKPTLLKYIKLASLPENILHMLDSDGPDKITLELAADLVKITADKLNEVVGAFDGLTSAQKSLLVDEYLNDSNKQISDIRAKIVGIKKQKIPKKPFIIDSSTGECIIIPANKYSEVLKLLKG